MSVKLGRNQKGHGFIDSPIRGDLSSVETIYFEFSIKIVNLWLLVI